ncbi:MAG TPA: glycyl-radical enzyme activating protein [Desulfomicrobiaceae bacterium]|nr:glycyl-radical enzyme activating protein [Desulfomicrobiaceae bacterium]
MLPDKLQKGTVFNIQKYSVHDGPGIRTIIFLKGCSLKCEWCSNPESQFATPQLAYNPNKCLTVDECTRCEGVCPENALSVGEDRKIVWDADACTNCLLCADKCPTSALNVYGYEVTVDDALKRVEEDEAFYARSGGGLTMSGGEPLFQKEFALALLREARKRRINTCIETCGQVDWETLKEAAQYLNTIFFDLKSTDAKAHQKATGANNARILSNLSKLKALYPDLKIRVRTPVIPGFNDNEKAIGAIVDFIKDMPNTEYELLAYHRMGLPKYEYLGKPYPLAAVDNLDQETFARLREFAEKRLAEHRDGTVGMVPEADGAAAQESGAAS